MQTNMPMHYYTARESSRKTAQSLQRRNSATTSARVMRFSSKSTEFNWQQRNKI